MVLFAGSFQSSHVLTLMVGIMLQKRNEVKAYFSIQDQLNQDQLKLALLQKRFPALSQSHTLHSPGTNDDEQLVLLQEGTPIP